ncbi:nucleotidyltransferase family protein [bacterium]|nr:nucleotidyltransferase family protein [bacterium]
MPKARIFAIVLAGGESRRMGTNKLALPLGGKSVLRRIVDQLNQSALDRVMVILGPTARDQSEDVPPPAAALNLSKQTSDMRSTLAEGLQQLVRDETPNDEDGVLVVLGDQPTIRAAIVNQLCDCYRVNSGNIIVASFHGKRGHPSLLPWKLLRSMENLPPDQGLNSLIRTNEERVIALEVNDLAVLEDLDVPADYDALKERNWD